ncbi:hypothetical protein Bpfe_016696 [Biomphalaria pfeifferi]|uniref:Uncharacterized protein n=1 Tax=Biomphalaria pfeifferi TaxID=112525 RepID=A0AAD8BG19_BIOPF|nr:hypothetical protein Bpfe_016696 [Biomphalaria pfeifferi]
MYDIMYTSMYDIMYTSMYDSTYTSTYDVMYTSTYDSTYTFIHMEPRMENVSIVEKCRKPKENMMKEKYFSTRIRPAPPPKPCEVSDTNVFENWRQTQVYKTHAQTSLCFHTCRNLVQLVFNKARWC